MLVLERRLAGRFSFLYVPRGPVLDSTDDEGKSRSLAEFAERARGLSDTAVFLRLDPPWSATEAVSSGDDETSIAGFDEKSRPAPGAPFRRASMDIQPPDTVILPLRNAGTPRSDEELLSAMKPKWRYNIRLAGKKGVAVADEGAAGIDVFYDLYRTTSERDRIAIHPKSYYETMFSLAKDYGSAAPRLGLWVARHEGAPLAAIITSFANGKAVYLYGASSDEKRNLMPAYALQWEAIRAARDSGCAEYDFFGIPPCDDPAHPMSGLYRFKTGFGGRIEHFAGSWDYVYRPVPYAAYRTAEAARKFWFKVVKKRLGGRNAAG